MLTLDPTVTSHDWLVFNLLHCGASLVFYLPLPDVGIDSLQEHLEIHLQKPLIRLVVLCVEECRPKNPRHLDQDEFNVQWRQFSGV